MSSLRSIRRRIEKQREEQREKLGILGTKLDELAANIDQCERARARCDEFPAGYRAMVAPLIAISDALTSALREEIPAQLAGTRRVIDDADAITAVEKAALLARVADLESRCATLN